MHPPDLLQPPRGWHPVTHPRLIAPPPAERGLLFRSLSRLSRRHGRPEMPTIFPVINLHRRLFPAWLWFASRLMPYGTLPGTVRERLILRTAWNCRCRYEWGQHLELGLRVGLTDAEALATMQDAAASPADIRWLLHACDELCRQDRLEEAAWQALHRAWGDAGLIEILMLIGHYRMLAGLLNSAELILEASIERRVQAFWQRVKPALSVPG